MPPWRRRSNASDNMSNLSDLWERENDQPFYWGTTQRPCEQAGWCHNLIEEAALARGVQVASLFADLAKFYEWVSHEILAREAKAVGFNMRLLRALFGLYKGKRAIVYKGAVGQVVDAVGTILAGCSNATTLAKVIWHRACW